MPSVRDEGHAIRRPRNTPMAMATVDIVTNGNNSASDSKKVFAAHGSYSRSTVERRRASRRGKRLARSPGFSGEAGANDVLRRGAVRQPQMTVNGLRAYATT